MEILWFGFFEFFLRNDPIVILVKVFEDLSEVFGSFLQELIANVIFAESNVVIIVNIKSFQELSGDFIFSKPFNVGIMSEFFNISNAFFDGIEN